MAELPFRRVEYRRRLARVLVAMASRGIDTLVFAAPENVYYLTGLDVYGFLAHQALIVSPRLPGPCLVHRVMEEPGVRETSLVTDAVYYQIPGAFVVLQPNFTAPAIQHSIPDGAAWTLLVAGHRTTDIREKPRVIVAAPNKDILVRGVEGTCGCDRLLYGLLAEPSH